MVANILIAGYLIISVGFLLALHIADDKARWFWWEV